MGTVAAGQCPSGAANGDSPRPGLSPAGCFPLAEGNSNSPSNKPASSARSDAPRQRRAPLPGSTAKQLLNNQKPKPLYLEPGPAARPGLVGSAGSGVGGAARDPRWRELVLDVP